MERWVEIRKGGDFTTLGKKLGVHPIIARIIRNRGMADEAQMKEYLYGTTLHAPELLTDLEKAANILEEKIRTGKKIRIIGDYDIDGVSATYILLEGFKTLGGTVDTVIPHRIKDGYGVNDSLMKQAIEDGIDTVVTCDNGIAAIDTIALGKEAGLTIVVTDHHEMPYTEKNGKKEYQFSAADAIVDPKRPDDTYPCKGICGAVVAWKLVEYLYRQFGLPREASDVFLENAAFATVGDVMDLIGENRTIVKLGLKRIANTKNPGLSALIAANELNKEEIKAYQIGFVLGPCINASGRLESAKRSLQLLCAKTAEEADKEAKELVALNESRKQMTAQGVEQADQLIAREGLDKDLVMVVFLPECHESLAGIIAGRIREKYKKPVFVLTRADGGEVKGSGRSVEGYSMYDEMTKCSDLFTKFGGHPMAAGLSMKEEDIPSLRKRLNEQTDLTEEKLIPVVKIDAVMPLQYLSLQFAEELSVLEPLGKGNEKPNFAAKDVPVSYERICGEHRNVVRMQLRTENGGSLTGVWFGDGDAFVEDLKKRNHTLSILYYPTVNEYRDTKSLQVMIHAYL